MTVRVLIPCHLAGEPRQEGLYDLNIAKDWVTLTLIANKMIEIVEESPIKEAQKATQQRGRRK